MNELDLHYCPDLFSYSRRESRVVQVGNVSVGGHNPIRIQSMITSDTRDTEACVKEILGLAAADCEIVRLTAQTRKYAANLENISKAIRAEGCTVPLVADIHFKPDAAMEAARWVEKIRVNPGNYVDKKKFEIREYTDEQYEEELTRIDEQFSPLVQLCLEKNRAMRIGTNHGSLSDRIMNRYGDTPLGMVESALEFAKIARQHDYHNFVFSMKASNPKVMIEAYRLLVARLYKLGGDWNYPIHLGVTEAGDGEDGRIKSSIGIGSLLSDGIGDTIRVSLTEDPIYEIPVAKTLVKSIEEDFASSVAQKSTAHFEAPFSPYSYERRVTDKIKCLQTIVGGAHVPAVFTSAEKWKALEHRLEKLGDFKPEGKIEEEAIVSLDPFNQKAIEELNSSPEAKLVTIEDHCNIPVIFAYRILASQLDARHPILLKDTFSPSTDPHSHFESNLISSSRNIGSLLCDGIGDAIIIQGEQAPGQSLRLAYNTLQASGSRIFKTDYVACPSCGRTLFNLQETTQKIRVATGHLKGVRIAIMGCIVNGPGEMADADFGYVGGAPSKINLYVGKKAVQFNIPESDAVDKLIELIKEHNKWIEPPVVITE